MTESLVFNVDPIPLPPGILPRRYGGDKLAFKPATAVQTDQGDGHHEEDRKLIDSITAVIDEYRADKRIRKKVLEEIKEEGIASHEGEAAKKRVLRWYHYGVLLNAGWFWEDPKFKTEFTISGLKNALLANAKLHNKISIEEARQGTESGHAFIRCASSSHLLYTVYFGHSRFPAEPSVQPDLKRLPEEIQFPLKIQGYKNVYVKIGHEDEKPGPVLKKHFVLDSNGVMTHRFVTRAFLVYNLATMFGFQLRPLDGEPFPDADEMELRTYLHRDTAARICRTTTPIAPPRISVEEGLAAQVPRYTKGTFGGHADVFDIRHAAAYEPGGLHNPDFTPYRTRGSTGSKFLTRTGLTVVTGYCEGRTKDNFMKRNERASMQVRNGSGPDQPYLSTAAIMADYKIIRGNKGERFDEGPENQGTVIIDLAIAQLMGVEIINQHAVESDRFKIAYARYYDKNDAIRIERRVALSLVKLVKSGELRDRVRSKIDTNSREFEIALDEVERAEKGGVEKLANLLAEGGVRPWDIGVEDDDMKGLEDDHLKQLMALRGDFDHKKIIKRTADLELEEYIASARKNREILMDRIPVECITHIKLNPDEGKWLDPSKFKDTEVSENYGPIVEALKKAHTAREKSAPGEAWVRFDDNFKKSLRNYLTDNDYANTKAMFCAAVDAKRKEDLEGKKNRT